MANINRWVGSRGPKAADIIPVQTRVDVHKPIAVLQAFYGVEWVRDYILHQNGNPIRLESEIRSNAREAARQDCNCVLPEQVCPVCRKAGSVRLEEVGV